MLAVLAEDAKTPEQIRCRGERAMNLGQNVRPRRSQGQCIHRIRNDRRCDACGRLVCEHGVGLHTSCPHCAAKADIRLDLPFVRYQPNGQPFAVKSPQLYEMTAGAIIDEADKNLVMDPVVRILVDGKDVTAEALAVDVEKGEVLLHQNDGTVVKRGAIKVIRRSEVIDGGGSNAATG